MYVIMVYDVAVERVSQVLTVARKYLHWVQNSVLEGEISEANLLRLQNEPCTNN
jgi:CRISPR-associated protein Cas2